MNYFKIYNALVSNKEYRKKGQGVYYESHHIIPRSMGGSNDTNNRCLLTAQEHYIAHRLLVKMYPTYRSMKYALFAMMRCSKDQNRKVTSRMYEVAKNEMSKAAAERKGELNSFYGKKHSEETREKLRQAGKLKVGKKNPNFGNYWTDEQKAALSKKNSGINQGELNPAKRPEVRKKLSEGKLGSGNPRSKTWIIKNVVSHEIIKVEGGLRRFLSKYPGSTSFKCINKTDPNWRIV